MRIVITGEDGKYPYMDRITKERLLTYGRRLRHWRRQRKISIEKLEKLTGLKVSRIKSIEYGTLNGVKVTDILVICTVLGVELSQLFADYLPIDIFKYQS